eukprot:50999-Eustigmatos_ZCMA.PRE.1
MELIAKCSMRLAQVDDIEDEAIEDDVEVEEEEETGTKKTFWRVYTNHTYKVVDVKAKYLILEDTDKDEKFK